MRKKLLLIDGGHTTHRAFYSTFGLHNKTGFPTSVIFGTINILKTILNRIRPYAMVFAWDSRGETFRHVLSKKYKDLGILEKHYKECDMVEKNEKYKDYYVQLKATRKILKYLGVQQVKKYSTEADDIIGTLCYKYKNKYDIYILSGDKDYYQLLDNNVSIIIPKVGELFTIKQFRKLYGIEPKQWVELGALMGDKSDVIQGIRGIGEKKGLKILQEYKTVKEYMRKELKCNKKSQTIIKVALKLKLINKYVDINIKPRGMIGINVKKIKMFLKKYDIQVFKIAELVCSFGGFRK